MPSSVNYPANLCSKFTEPFLTWRISDGTEFYILPHLLKDGSELRSMIDDRVDISLEAAHVVVNHLYYGKYEHIRLNGSSEEDRLRAEYATDIRVYAFCRRMQLLSLQELAKQEILRLGKLLSFIAIADAAQSAYPEIAVDDAWFIDYLETVIKSIPPDEPASWVEQIPDKKTLKVKDVLLQGFLKSRCEKRQKDSTESIIAMTPKASEPGTHMELSACQVEQSAPDSPPSGSWTEAELNAHTVADSAECMTSPPVSIEFIRTIKSTMGDSCAHYCIMSLTRKLCHKLDHHRLLLTATITAEEKLDSIARESGIKFGLKKKLLKKKKSIAISKKRQRLLEEIGLGSYDAGEANSSGSIDSQTQQPVGGPLVFQFRS